MSHVQYGTGARLDPGELAALAHAYDAVLVLDAYQSAGVVPLDVVSTDVDILVAGAMKWLCGIPGAAFCYLRPEIVERFRPGIVGWRSPEDPPVFDARAIRLAPGARRMEFATMAYSAGLGLGRAIDYVLDAGIDRILAHNLALGTRLMDGLETLGAILQTPRDPASKAGIVNARFPRRNAAAVTRRLNDAGVIVSPRLGGTRFSVHMFNNRNDVDSCLEFLDSLLGAHDS
jgi:selenocysteine lyase/cysteine desulfurase